VLGQIMFVPIRRQFALVILSVLGTLTAGLLGVAGVQRWREAKTRAQAYG